MFVYLINSCGLTTGSVVNVIPDIPLPRGRGAQLGKMGGGGGGGCLAVLTCTSIFIALNYVGPKVNIWERTELFS